MKIRYITRRELTPGQNENVQVILDCLKERLGMRKPETGSLNQPIYIDLQQKNIKPGDVFTILQEFERRGILEILKNNFPKDLNPIPVKVNKEKFESEYRGPVKAQGKKLKAIEKITCVSSKSDPDKMSYVVINDDYDEAIKCKGTKLSWSLLFDVARGKEIIYREYHKSSTDYFNSNKKNPLYTKGGCKVRQILKTEDYFIKPAIKMEVISDEAFKRRLGKNKGRKG